MRRLLDLFGKRSKNPRSWYDMGVRLTQEHKLAEAREAFARALESTEDPNDCIRVGIAAEGLEDAHLAISAYRRATELDPCSLEGFLNAGKLVLALGHFQDAVKFLRRAVFLSEFEAEPCLNLALALERMGEMDEATSHAYIATKDAPENVEAFRVLGRLLSQSGRKAGAVRAWRQAAALSPKDASVMGPLGIALAEVGEPEEAAHVLSDVVQLSPHSAQAHTNLGMVLSQLGALDAGLRCLQRALQLEPRSAEMNLNLGVLLLRAGRIEDAVGALYQATQLAPDWVAAQYNMGLALRAYGDPQGARSHLIRASQLDPNDAEIKEVLEELLLEQVNRPGLRNPKEEPTEPSDGDAAQKKGRSIAGELESFPLVDILEFLKLNQSSGTLQVWSGMDGGEIQLHKGDLAGARHRELKSLTDRLLDRGVVTKLDLEIAFGEDTNFEDSGSVGAVLVEDGILPLETVVEAVRQQVEEVLKRMVAWESGNFSFDSEKETKPSRGTPVTVDTREVVMAVMTSGDELRAGLVL